MNEEQLILPKIETERLILRPIGLEDAQDMFEYASDEKVLEFMTFPKHQSVDDSRNIIEKFIKKPKNGMPTTYAIIFKDDNKMIGTCDFPVFIESRKTAEVGYILNSSYWGRGIMPEAVKALIRVGFERFDLNRIQVCHSPRNTKSRRVIEKCGFTYEGIARGFIPVGEGYEDVPIYSITKGDFYQE